MDLYQAIRNRVSVRRYENKPLELATAGWIMQRALAQTPMYPGIKTRIELITDKKHVDILRIGFLGGMAKINAPACLVTVTENTPDCMENMGFMAEQLVLELTAKGLGTCWLGTFDSRIAHGLVDGKSNETVTNIITVGYPGAQGSFLNSGIRKLAGSGSRRPLEDTAFYKTRGSSIADFLQKKPAFKRILEMSALAPSANNAQPVRVLLLDNEAHFYTADARMPHKQSFNRLDAGIFISHFFLSCKAEGMNPEIYKSEDQAEGMPHQYVYVASMRY